ncbi:DUF982 domain-containing protein [Pseudaminobacter soli (ex Li et al. 2025)]|uniref:DUF982 domain-containing protein n=1 Tax=Pseudaminobacter soli (ex Li et al. 2025) TaxID=1295366 RepID=A0A2P7S935_9HYPH|nr:DUF982 domain-containing protein [Mesorhizobium soli]PSJ59008.1 DUF982 domain-containing protein [Mesorhizobium soli]
MGMKLFHKPVRVQIGRIDRDRIVLGTEDAAKILLRAWPSTCDKKRQEAMRACLEVIKGKKPPSVARKAFIAAAQEARVLLDEEVRA